MTNVKCFNCNTTNFVSEEVCRGCGVELLQPLPYSEAQPSTDGRDPGIQSIASIPPFDTVGDVLRPTLSLFVKNIWLIIRIVFVIVAPFEIFKAASIGRIQDDWQLAIGLFFLQLLCGVLIAPALIYALTKVADTGNAPGIGESYRWGVSKLGKLILCAAIAWLLEFLGTLLLIIPGIIIALAFFLVYPIAVLEKHSVFETLRRSRELTDGYRLKILGGAILLFIILAAVSFSIEFVFGSGPVSTVLRAIIVDILKQVTTVYSLVLYLGILRTLGRRQSVIK